MGQTVNLLAKPSEVRILPPPLFNCGSSSSGRATAFQAVGGGFESRFPLKIVKTGRRSSGVERFLGKEEVTGSIPVVGSTGRIVESLFIKP